MRKSNSGRRRFKRDVIGVALTISSLAIGATGYFATQIRHDISERYIEDASASAVAAFGSMRAPVIFSLEFVRDYGASGVVSLSRPEDLKAKLHPIFKNQPMLSGITLADKKGRSYFILPDGTERLPSAAEGFDPRERSWFKDAVEVEGVSWSEQYLFHTLRKLGITASTAFYPNGEKEPVVVAFDILLDDLYKAIEEMAPTANSKLFFFRGDDALILSGAGEGTPDFAAMSSISNSLVSIAHVSWKDV